MSRTFFAPDASKTRAGARGPRHALINWLWKLVSRSPNRSGRRQALRPPSRWDRYLVLEHLEDRLHLSVTASVVGTTLTVNLGAANDTATITGVALSSVTVAGTGFSPTPFSGFNDIQIGGTGSAAGQSVHFNGSGGVQDIGNFGGIGISVTNVQGVFVDTSASSLFGSITFTGAATITAGAIQAGGAGGISTGATNATGPGITLSASGAITLNGHTSTTNVMGNNSAGPNSMTTGSINVTSSGGSITGTGQLVTGNATAPGTPGADSATSGSIILNAGGAVTLSAANALTVGSATVTSASAGDTTRVGDMAIKAATGIGFPATPLSTQGSTLSAQTGTGGIFVSNTGALNINGGVISGINGVQVSGASGDINLTNAGSVSITNPGDIVKAPGNIAVTANGAAGDLQTAGNNDGTAGFGAIQAGGTAAVTTGRDLLVGSATGFGDIDGSGRVVLNAGRDLMIADGSFADSPGSGTVTATVGRNISVSSGRIASHSGAITLTTGAGGVLAVGISGAIISNESGAGAVIVASADDMNIQGPINAGSATVTLQPVTASRIIDLGTNSAGNLGLTDAELAQVTAGTLVIGNTADTGNIQVTAPIAAHAGYATLSLRTGGAIVDNNAAEPDVRVANLALRAANGMSLDTAASSLAFSNAGGAVSVRNTGALTINAVDGLSTSSNTGTTTALSAASPITFSVNTSSAGSLSATTSETASETGTPLPPPDDNLTVNGGVTVESTGGDVVLTSGDSVVTQSASTVKSDTGAIYLTIGSADNDNDASLSLNGTLSAATVTFTAPGNIFLDVLPSALTNRPGQTLAVTSTGGGIFDNTTPDGTADDTDVTAGSLALSASTGIGAGTDPLEIVVSNLSAKTATGGIFLSNTGNLAIGFNGEPFGGVQVTGASGDIRLTSAGSIAVNRSGDVIKGPGNVTVQATGAASDVLAGGNNGLFSAGGPGAIASTGTGSMVSVQTGRDVLIGDPASGLGNVESAGSISLTAGRNINVDVDSFVDAHGTGTLTATAGGNIALLHNTFQGARVTSQGGAIALTTGAGGTFTADSGGGGTVATASNGPITIAADDMVISNTISAGTGTVTFQPVSPSRVIDLGTNSAGNLGLSDAELAQVTAGTLLIGNTADTGNIQVTAPITAHAGYATLSLRTGGAIVDNNAVEPDVRVTNLPLRAGTGISLDTAATNLAFSNAAGTVRISNTGALTINAVDGLTSSSNTGTTTTLSAASPITFAVNTTSAGTLTATANETTPPTPNLDNITVNAGVTVQSTGGDVVLLAGDNIIVNNAASVLAPGGSIDFRSGFGDNDGEGTMTLNGTVAANAAAGTVALNVNVPNASVTEATTGTISGAGLLLLNSPPSGGLFSLDASPTNSVPTIAASTQAAISFRDAAALTVGTVTSANEGVTGVGISTNNHDVTLSTMAGDISLTQALNVGSGSARLAAGAVGAITQSAAGKITAANLGAAAGGAISLLSASPTNHVTGTVALSTQSTHGIGFQDDAAFMVGTVTASAAFAGATGISSGGDVTLCAGGALTIAAPINAPETARLQAAGVIVQVASGPITAANLGVVAGGNIALSVSGAPNNIGATFAESTAGGPAASSIDFLNAGAVSVGTLTAASCFAGATGILSGGDATLNVGGGLTIEAPVNAAGTVRLQVAGPISQVAVGMISAANLGVIAKGNVTLFVAGAPNSISGTFAANTANGPAGSSIDFLNSGALSVGTVAASSSFAGAAGVQTNAGDVDLQVQGPGALLVTEPVNTGGGGAATIRLDSGGAVSQTAPGVLGAGNLAVTAAGDVTLSQSNAIGTVAAAVTGSGHSISLSNASGFTVGSIAGDPLVAGASGISASGNVTLAPTSGILTISKDISAAALTLSPGAGGVHQTAGTIIANSLIQSAGSVLSIYAGSIFTSAGGVQLNGSDFSITGPINLNSGPLAMSDTGAATISGAISGSGGLVMNGPGTLTLNIANTYTGATTINAGTLIVAAAGALPAVQSVANNGLLQINADSSPGAITGSGMLAVKSATLTVPSFSQGAVTIQSAGTLKLPSTSPTTSSASSLSIDADSRLDMTTNSLRIPYGAAPDPVATIRAYLTSGYNAGAWTGPGISTSAGNATHALGLGDAADGTVSGLAANTLLIRYTRYGDVNLDGTVGFADLVALARHYGQSHANWDQGDMNYDGVVGFADLVALARNYGASAAAQPALAPSPAAAPDLSILNPRRRRR